MNELNKREFCLVLLGCAVIVLLAVMDWLQWMGG